jgi:hypothetical protein
MLSKFFRRITCMVEETNTALVFINQLRVDMNSYGGGSTSTGGKSLPYYATLRINLTKVKLDDSVPYEIEQAMQVKTTVRKNRLATGYPFVATTYVVLFAKGIDRDLEVLTIAATKFEKSGSWLYYPTKAEPMVINGKKLAFNGRKAFTEAAQSDEDIFDFLRKLASGATALEEMSQEEIELAIKENEEDGE